MRRAAPAPTLAALALLALVLTACSTGTPPPGPVAAAFLAAWDRADTPAMAALQDSPGPAFAADIAAVTAGLHATSVTRTAGPATIRGPTATVPLTSVYQLAGAGPWTVRTTLTLARRAGRWRVEWSPAAAAPGLGPGSRLTSAYQWPARAPILGAGGLPLTGDIPEVVVGIEGSRVKDAPALTAVLTAAGATPATVGSALAAAAAHPTFFEPALTLSEARFEALGGHSSALYQAPGTVFQHTTARSAVTAGLAAHLVGTVGPVTAEELSRLGPPYAAGDAVGQHGLEALYEKQLAGTPSVTVQAVDPSGRTVATLATFPGRPGTAVQTGIDPAVQQAAEAALSPLAGTAALVAVRASTGQVLAAVSEPGSDQFDYALAGSFPPGSTFKILTATALLQAGLSPASPAACPPQVTVDGKVFTNAEGDHAAATLAAAFTESCNTAFVQLATTHLRPADFASVASQYCLGAPLSMGFPAFAGSVPTPTSPVDLAATAIGQGSVLASPLDMAVVAAAAASGACRPPRLVAGAPADTAAPRALPAAVAADLRTMMAGVVSQGTAAGTGLPAGTYAKTGTAEYGTGNPLPTDAWLVGFRGDVAFAMVVQGSHGDGGPVDGPVVARFLRSLPPAYQP